MTNPDLSILREQLEHEIEDRRAAEQQIEEYQNRLRQLATEVSLAEARERREIALTLHDSIIQEFAFIKLRVQQFRGDAVFCGFERNLDEILSLLDGAIRKTRTLTFEISPPILYELGLAAAMEWLAEQYEKRHHIKIDCKLKSLPAKVSEAMQVTLYKCVQELLTNAMKYARAGRLQLCMNALAGSVQISVADDGDGFNVAQLESNTGTEHGFGLFSIRERLKSFGGKMGVVSAPGRGTKVTLTVPFES